jgi:CTP synthase
VVGWHDAHSTEFDKHTPHPVIDLMAEQRDIHDMGGTMRLGAYPCKITEGSRAHTIYGSDQISERHRHRYEFNNELRDELERHGLLISGINPDKDLVEIIELPDHPFFVGVQFHPEYRSTVARPHPLFGALLDAAGAAHGAQA